MLVIIGPTASGKTRLAVQLAQQHNGEIISADSRQVYRGMDIGTGKDLAEYVVDGQVIPYHLIDIVDAGDDYNVFRYQQDFDRALQDILSRGKTPILCGGSGMYIEAALRPTAMLAVPTNADLRARLEPLTDSALRDLFTQNPSPYSPLADTSTRKRLIRAIEIGQYLNEHPDAQPAPRPPLPPYRVIGLDPPVAVRRERISRRLRDRLQHGLMEEVQRLLGQGISPEKLIFYGLEYKFVTEYLQSQLTYNEVVTQLETAIHQFAKRQMTFFRKLEREGMNVQWIYDVRLTNYDLLLTPEHVYAGVSNKS
ncbi:tRNA (adenosine(37)-N6)-dimethylallyltransferase MiaA [Fibrella aquatilis]|uniref:tRNA dimethylallyltransferase n=1 Tax=Fibrella aquatilis TaxID=2817059 RepID=A0A939G876_9BACT|nr:tRNA (adenosine(37)-N6)-dimethylallyltransferase MiaA [Fibrella aquatilis]MBO0932429.1 tRNA (adenosine(37)-N6)-dimethylallyltransferase MiaA [Fibrella aquatilis]